MRHDKLGATPLALDLGLPGHAEHALFIHDQLIGAHVHGVVIAERRKHHAQPPPCEQADGLRLLLVHHKELHCPHDLGGNGHGLFQSASALADHLRLKSQEPLMIHVRAFNSYSLDVTHLTEVLKEGITEGPHSLESKNRAY